MEFRKGKLKFVDANQLRMIVAHYRGDSKNAEHVELAEDITSAYGNDYETFPNDTPIMLRTIDQDRFSDLLKGPAFYSSLANKGPPLRSDTSAEGNVRPNSALPQLSRYKKIVAQGLIPPLLPATPTGQGMHDMLRDTTINSELGLVPSRMTSTQYDVVSQFYRVQLKHQDDERKNVEGDFVGELKLLTTQEKDVVAGFLRQDPLPNLASRGTLVGDEFDLGPASYQRIGQPSALGQAAWFSEEIVNYFYKMLGEHLIDMGYNVMVMTTMMGNQFYDKRGGRKAKTVPQMKKAFQRLGWNQASILVYDLVLIPVFTGTHFMVAIAEPKVRTIKVFDGYGDSQGARGAGATWKEIFKAFANLTMEVHISAENNQKGDANSCGPLVVIRPVLFVQGLTFKSKRFGLVDAEETRAWINYQILRPGAKMDGVVFERLGANIGIPATGPLKISDIVKRTENTRTSNKARVESEKMSESLGGL